MTFSANPDPSGAANDVLQVEKLKTLILSSIYSHTKNHRKTAPTIGVEVEFFILDKNKCPADLETSQNFLQQLSIRQYWSPSTDSSHSNLALSAVSKENADGKYTKVKYEYAPHMLEIAFAYFSDINELFDEVAFVLNEIYHVAEHSGIQVAMTPFLSPLETVHIKPESPKIRDLNQSRQKYLRSQSVQASPEIFNFPSYMAGTQVHIGGINWWDNTSVMTNLYALEAVCPLFGTSLSNSNIGQSIQTLDRRAYLYEQCFPDVALIGFPALDKWTLETWIQALLTTPLCPSESHRFSGISYQNIPVSDRPTLESVFSSLRDLQFIRPRFLGTIEFRVEPSMDTAEKIAGLAAWRLGLALLAYQTQSENSSLADAKKIWNIRRRDINSLKDVDAINLISSVIAVLRSRGNSEEKFIGTLR